LGGRGDENLVLIIVIGGGLTSILFFVVADILINRRIVCTFFIIRILISLCFGLRTAAWRTGLVPLWKEGFGLIWGPVMVPSEMSVQEGILLRLGFPRAEWTGPLLLCFPDRNKKK
jgi:hypothetical protein